MARRAQRARGEKLGRVVRPDCPTPARRVKRGLLAPRSLRFGLFQIGSPWWNTRSPCPHTPALIPTRRRIDHHQPRDRRDRSERTRFTVHRATERRVLQALHLLAAAREADGVRPRRLLAQE